MTEKTTISRRTVAKGIAWSVPAVAVSAAVPAYAASPVCVTVSQTGLACKNPGQSTQDPWSFVALNFTFANTCATGCVTIKVTAILQGNAQTLAQAVKGDPFYTDTTLTTAYDLPDTEFELCAGQSVTLNDVVSPDIPSPLYSSNSGAGIIVLFSVNGVDTWQTLGTPPNCTAASTTSTTTQVTSSTTTTPVTTSTTTTQVTTSTTTTQ